MTVCEPTKPNPPVTRIVLKSGISIITTYTQFGKVDKVRAIFSYADIYYAYDKSISIEAFIFKIN
jgi:hypothetical protein